MECSADLQAAITSQTRSQAKARFEKIKAASDDASVSRIWDPRLSSAVVVGWFEIKGYLTICPHFQKMIHQQGLKGFFAFYRHLRRSKSPFSEFHLPHFSFSSNSVRYQDPGRPVRLRFAPSPTGYLHLGGLRTALFNHLLARKLNGKWILRIEDTDQSRLVQGAVESMMATLKWAKLDYDEGPDRLGSCGPYIQSQRNHIYKFHLDRLLKSKNAYRCFCTPERLVAMRQNFKQSGSTLTYDRKCLQLDDQQVDQLSKERQYVVRLKNPDTSVMVDDLVYGQLRFLNNTQDDVILIKADGTPTYHFANVVDDHEMGISHVLRGEEWLSSAPKHILLYQALGFTPPQFAHLPLLINPDGSKLSKRSGDVRVEDFMIKGYEPEALLNFVALMGMTHPQNSSTTNQKDENSHSDVMTMDQMISAFAIEAIGKHRAIMHQPKLDYLNQQHIAQALHSLDNPKITSFISRARTLLISNKYSDQVYSDAYIQKVLQTMKDRLHVFSDLKYLAEYFFDLPDLTIPEAIELKCSIPDNLYIKILEYSRSQIVSLSDEDSKFTRKVIFESLKSVQQKDPEMKPKQVMATLRHAITGRKVGAPIAVTIEVLGKKQTLERINAALQSCLKELKS
ncbi:hypothetical protein O181_042218 [Austropuccinia psidii MF-1]|uniref:Glutamate--tRNA ligase, mitochondrial n=1 Tax=Austropuccinia psidii MF-1 TaxID=1389203 RepID=A0A9Q3DIY6_9BASI|nr:hypothetical protein [Austropuccinia psidii MF-1]